MYLFKGLFRGPEQLIAAQRELTKISKLKYVDINLYRDDKQSR